MAVSTWDNFWNSLILQRFCLSGLIDKTQFFDEISVNIQYDGRRHRGEFCDYQTGASQRALRVSVHLRITIVRNGGSSVPERSCAIDLPTLQFTCLTRQSFAMVGNQKTLPTLRD